MGGGGMGGGVQGGRQVRAQIVSVIAVTSAFCLRSSALVVSGSAAITSSRSTATHTHAQHSAAATSVWQRPPRGMARAVSVSGGIKSENIEEHRGPRYLALMHIVR